ncbi:MAG: hypothetical protein K1X68_00385 [Saprospiraceae bacterium]|nr:hypothetical protein [Saprospiraceae bacterium]HMW38605.1 hypothetical protein [Saprospiraceae bacterium]HMX88503.1 hypothetical protein [Saprospiraceae bacterium]HMZ40521.1 hypothetical protein [Saprospiraceae bacterium]HNA64574.1 hypothetical protein [Saprospiraceae bacterium]
MRLNFSLIVFVTFVLASCNQETGLDSGGWTRKILFPEFNWNSVSVINNKTLWVMGSRLNEKDQNLSALYKLLKSYDAGNTWSSIYDNADIWQKGGWNSMQFANSKNGYITGYRTLFKTHDGGSHWDTMYLGDDDFSKVFSLDSLKLFGYGLSGFYRSCDAGRSWQKDDQFNNIKAIDFINESVGFMVGIQGSFKTIDSGKTWTANSTYIADFTKLDFLDEHHAVALINEKHSRDEYPVTYFMITVDGGETWNKYLPLNVALEASSSLLYQSVDKIYLGGVEGVYSSSDHGEKWKLECRGEWIRDIKRVGDHIIAVGNGGLILMK